MKTKLMVKLKYPNKETTIRIAKSTEPDNDEYISVRVEGNYIIVDCENENALTVLQTIDDFLSAVSLSEKIQKF